MVYDGSVDINKYESETGDKSFFEGNYYSDKAPGATFTALPSIFVSKIVLDFFLSNHKMVDNKGKLTGSFFFITQAATIATSALFTAIAAVILYFTALKIGSSLSGAVFGALCYGLATPAWGWATVFFGHALAAATLFMGLASVLYLLQSKNRRQDIVFAFLSGALLTWSIVVDYTSAPVSVFIALFWLIQAWSWNRKRLVVVITTAFIAGLIFLFPLLIYNYSIFGDIFTLGYSHVPSFPGMKEGVYGIQSPKLDVLVKLLIGPHNGILWFSPILIFIPVSLYLMFKNPKYRALSVLILIIAIYYFAWNSGYAYWTGGSSTGPRFLTPMLPFLSLSLVLLWSSAGKYLKRVLIFFFAISFLISFLNVSVSMLDYKGFNFNLYMISAFPEFFEVSKYKISFYLKLLWRPFDGSSLLHLFPLFVILIIGFTYIVWLLNTKALRRV